MLSKKENQSSNPWDAILLPENEEEENKRGAQMLMFRFLSEIERFQEIQGQNRKTLSINIKTSQSYVTQLFRGDKPLNFISIYKMGKALKIDFEVRARPLDDCNFIVSENNYTKNKRYFEKNEIILEMPISDQNKEKLNKYYV